LVKKALILYRYENGLIASSAINGALLLLLLYLCVRFYIKRRQANQVDETNERSNLVQRNQDDVERSNPSAANNPAILSLQDIPLQEPEQESVQLR